MTVKYYPLPKTIPEKKKKTITGVCPSEDEDEEESVCKRKEDEEETRVAFR